MSGIMLFAFLRLKILSQIVVTVLSTIIVFMGSQRRRFEVLSVSTFSPCNYLVIDWNIIVWSEFLCQ